MDVSAPVLDRQPVVRAHCPDWLVIQTHSNREALAAENLRNQFYDVYAPVISKLARHARQTREVRRPLFPGYIFVARHTPAMQWRAIRSTIGVRSIITNGNTPSTLANSFIATLQDREVSGVIARAAAPRELGDVVRLARGPFEGLAATIVALGEHDRLVVLMNLLNGAVRVQVSEDQLSAV
ncbi:transcriptional activator RfaH [Hyphomicrobium methylovorum]|uniref:transcription termination/antitermination protein NusG n=1 Tax=Hyphomicrobium methylovorum TaxID=84 RepID=UPI0015E787AB|nr:transcription termination/antitermination NusG family protein [Hyphomicrobium methylovorum]MBA2125507.1 transcriptional activator RfaH [Hyphomicrobium methylovorum]